MAKAKQTQSIQWREAIARYQNPDLKRSLWQVRPLTILTSLKSLGCRLWDEKSRRLVGFKALKTRMT